jgi:hypothetical protein
MQMKYIQITCHQSLVEKVVMELGNKGVFQFLDSNHTLTAVQRSSKHSLFAHALTQIRRCDDMERIVRYLNSEMRRVIDANQDAYLDDDIDDVAINAAMESGRFENIYEDTKRIEGMLRDMASTLNQCTANLNTELERKQVLIAGREFYHLRTNPALDHHHVAVVGGKNGFGTGIQDLQAAFFAQGFNHITIFINQTFVACVAAQIRFTAQQPAPFHGVAFVSL